MAEKLLVTPLTEDQIRSLNIGDVVYLSGHLYTSRDMGHLRMRELIEKGEPLPKDLRGSVIFHAGPVALMQKDGSWVLRAVGPTTSIRMEAHADLVGKLGVRAIIGKGGMEKDTERCCQEYGYVYLQAAPGCAAKLASGIRKICDVNWIELGVPEAMWDFEADHFGPLVVSMDAKGNNIYRQLREQGRSRIDAMYPQD